jgi:hypothetical protein
MTDVVQRPLMHPGSERFQTDELPRTVGAARRLRLPHFAKTTVPGQPVVRDRLAAATEMQRQGRLGGCTIDLSRC